MTRKPHGKWILKIRDSDNHEVIENSLVVVTDLGKKFNISKSNNTISLSQKPIPSKNGKYPYGYTIVTYSKGYLPRIDHNMTMGGSGDTNMEIELLKPKDFQNQAYTEVFHSQGDALLVDFFNQNLGNISN